MERPPAEDDFAFTRRFGAGRGRALAVHRFVGCGGWSVQNSLREQPPPDWECSQALRQRHRTFPFGLSGTYELPRKSETTSLPGERCALTAGILGPSGL